MSTPKLESYPIIEDNDPNSWYASQNLKNYLIGDEEKLDNEHCERDAPYIVDGKCSSCNGDYPIYDVKNQKCVDCPEGTFFSENGHQCLAVS